MKLIAQIISIFAMAMNVLSFQNKVKRNAIAFQFFGGLLFSVSFFMLGAFVGGLLNLIGVARSIVYINEERFKAKNPIWLVIFITLYFVSYVLTFTVFGKDFNFTSMLIELLPVIGMIATNISFAMNGAKAIRFLGLISSPSWLIYNIVNLSLGAILCEVFSIFSIIIGIIRFDIKRKEK